MKRVLTAGVLAATVLWFSGQAGVANAFTEPDAMYYGTVAINGQAASAGTRVSARVAGDVVATTTVGLDPAAGSGYVLRILLLPVTSGTSRQAGWAQVGDTVTLYVNGAPAVNLYIPDRGPVQQVNLAFSSSGKPGPTAGASGTPGEQWLALTGCRHGIPRTNPHGQPHCAGRHANAASHPPHRNPASATARVTVKSRSMSSSLGRTWRLE